MRAWLSWLAVTWHACLLIDLSELAPPPSSRATAVGDSRGRPVGRGDVLDPAGVGRLGAGDVRVEDAQRGLELPTRSSSSISRCSA